MSQRKEPWGIVFLTFVLFVWGFFFFVFCLVHLSILVGCDCRFPSWPVWSPRFSKLRLSKRGGLGQQPLPVLAPSVLSADGPASNTSSSSSGIGGVGTGSDGPETMATLRCPSYSNHTSPLSRPHSSWRPISPLAVGRPQPLGLTASKPPPVVPVRPIVAPAAAAAVPTPHESSLGHSRYSIRHHPTLVCFWGFFFCCCCFRLVV